MKALHVARWCHGDAHVANAVKIGQIKHHYDWEDPRVANYYEEDSVINLICQISSVAQFTARVEGLFFTAKEIGLTQQVNLRKAPATRAKNPSVIPV